MTGPRKAAGRRGPLLGIREGRNAAVRMRELRGDLTQDDVAERLGRKRSWLAARERGEIRLSVAEAELIAKVLGTDLAGLTGGTA